MATPKKKHLIELMIEAGVKWPDGAEYAAQDKRDRKLYFFERKPTVLPGDEHFCAPGGPIGYPYSLPSLCRNWHQTIVTREQYAEALTANVSEHAAMPKASERERDQAVDAVDAVEWHNPPSIEQLADDYHAKSDEADRLQAVADEALKAADDALLALEKAGELIGLVISIDTKPKPVEQPVITDWRDLRVGDVIECIEPNGGCIYTGDEGVITSIESGYFLADFIKQKDYIYDKCQFGCEFKFIRRP